MTTITVDKAGRVLIPKALRQKLRLNPGDSLQLENEGNEIRLRPVQTEVSLKKERGVWVYQGEPTDASIVDLIDLARDERLRDIVG